MNKKEKQLFEKLAGIEHERWADWQKYLHSLCIKTKTSRLIIPVKLVSRWEEQIATDYKDLSEKEKDSDREQVLRYWNLIRKFYRSKSEKIIFVRKITKMEQELEGKKMDIKAVEIINNTIKELKKL